MPIQIFSSNRIEILYQCWKGLLYQAETPPFQRRLVIAPSPAMKSWLQLQLAKDKDTAICFGMEIGGAEHLVMRLYNALFTSPKEVKGFPSSMEFVWMFEIILREICEHEWKEEEDLWLPLLDYLHPNGPNPKKNELHLLSFASHLAQLFMQYGQYACPMLDEWETGLVHEWQAKLWCIFKKKYPSLIFPNQMLARQELPKEIPPNSIAVHVFAMSFLPPCIHAFFQTISDRVPIYYYQLSPCQMFWGDLCSDKQKRRLQTFWEQKGVSSSQLTQLEAYLNDRNALLANLGSMGREMNLGLESCAAEASEIYVLPAAAENYPCFAELQTDEILLDTSTSTLSLLQALQTDIVLQRNPCLSAKIDLPATDSSIQVMRAPTKQREIEILYNQLVHLITASADLPQPILPSDIIVMAPDLQQYESAITALFSCEESVLSYQLMEVPTTGKSSLVRGFLHLLELGMSRWEMKTVLHLLDYPEFQQKHGFLFSEVLQIREWIEKSGIHWGQTPSHRSAALSRDYSHAMGKGALAAETNANEKHGKASGTWEYGMGRLLMGLAVDPEPLKSLQFEFDLPLDGVESGHIDLFAKWMALVNQLEKDLHPLLNQHLTLKEWSHYLQTLKESYFAIESKNKEAAKRDLFLTTQIRAIAVGSARMPHERFSFYSIKAQLEKKVLEEKTNYREGDLQAVRFCSLLPMRAVPAQIVVLIGMEEGAFPRSDIPNSLNLIPRFKDHIYAPSQVDFDRYLFLEALISARQHLILSYVGYSSAEQKETSPSLLIRELLSYLDEGYTLDGKKPSMHCCKDHPFDAFHKSYFEAGHASYLWHHHRMALAHYSSEKSPPHQLVSNFLQADHSQNEADPKEPETTLLNLKELENCASNPIKTYLNRHLRIHISKKMEQGTELFEVTPLDKFQLKREAIHAPLEEVICRATRQGKLPTGMFKKIASSALESDISAMQQTLSKNGVDCKKKRLSILFSECYTTPQFTAGTGWLLPPLQLQMGKRQFKIVGLIDELTESGLIYHSDRDLKQLVKLWPKALLLLSAIQQHNLPIQPQLITSKHAKPISIARENPIFDLKTFVEYFLASSKALSLLLPEWVAAILEEKESINKIIHAHMNDEFTPFYNEYARWLFSNHALLLEDVLPKAWQEIAAKVYGDLPALLAL